MIDDRRRIRNAAVLIGLIVAGSLGTLLPGCGETRDDSLNFDDPPLTADATGATDDPQGWPRTFQDEGLTFTIYQPQLETWNGVRTLARAAVSVADGVSPQPVYGVVWIAARALIDKEDRVVTLEDVSMTRASFPTDPDKAERYLAVLKAHVPDHVKTIDLERFEACVAILHAEQKTKGVPLKNDPPRIVFSSRPAVLVLVDGKPVLRRAGTSGLLRVINTRSLLLQDGGGRYYLCLGERWIESASLDGPWTISTKLPDGAESEKSAAVVSRQADLFSEDAELTAMLAKGELPQVFTSTVPAELIETTGEPEFVPVEGTQLLWIKNTKAAVFLDTTTKLHYALASGRWFRSPSLAGPWTFVAGSELPADFAKIPPTQPAGEVLASVPGTPQAQEAVIANEIPQTATVKRSDAKLDVTYDGEPNFAPIEGTDLKYALDTATPVIQVSGQSYYACSDGVWFVSSTPAGPWVICDQVPAAIYTIPPSCPDYYVTYCRVYEATPDYVWVGYTPGYLGACMSTDGCVVWGTGFYYQPWIGGVWYGRPWTYGFGVGIGWSMDYGWGIGIGLGGRLPGHPWWGPLAWSHPAFHPGFRRDFRMSVNNANVYRHWGGAIAPRGAGSVERFERGRTNNVYSTPEGRVYRNTNQGWQSYEHNARSWQPSSEAHFENESRARDSGANRWSNVRSGGGSVAPGFRGGWSRGGGGGRGHR